LDTACARVAIGLNTIPPSIEAESRQIGQIDREMKILKREVLMGRDHAERLESLHAARRPYYERCDATVVTDDKTAGQVAREVIELAFEWE